MRVLLACGLVAACAAEPTWSSSSAPLADPAAVTAEDVCFTGRLADGTEVPLGGVLYRAGATNAATRAMLFVGGVSGGSGPFDGMARRLARHGYVAVRYDKPGSSPRSPAPAGFGFSVTREQLSDLHAQVVHQLHTGQFSFGTACPGAVPARAGFAHVAYYGLSAGGAEGIEMIGRHPDLPVRALVVSGAALDGVAGAPAYLRAHAERQQPAEYVRLAENTADCELLFLDVTNVAPPVRRNLCFKDDATNNIPRAPVGALRTGGAQALRNRSTNARRVLELGVPVLRVFAAHDTFVPGPSGPYFTSSAGWFTPPPPVDVRLADAKAWASACRGETCEDCESLEPCDVSLLEPPRTGHVSPVHLSAPDEVDAIVAWLAERGLGPTPRR